MRNTKLVDKIQKTKLSPVHSIQIPLNKIENKNRDGQSILSTQLPEIESTYSSTILENKEDEQRKELEERKIEVKEENREEEERKEERKEEQKIEEKFEPEEGNQPSLTENFEADLSTATTLSKTLPTSTIPKIPKLQTVKLSIEKSSEANTNEDKINNNVATSNNNALISGEGHLEEQEEEGRTTSSDDDLIWAEMREGEDGKGRKFKNHEEEEEKEEKEEKRSEGLVSNEAEPVALEPSRAPSLEESDRKEQVPSERKNLQPLPEHEEEKIPSLFTDQHIKQEQQQIPLESSNLGEVKHEEQRGEDTAEVNPFAVFSRLKNFFIQNTNPLIISNNERQQLPIIFQEEKIKEEEQHLKALPEVEIEDLKTPLNKKINDSTGLKNI